MMQDRTKMALPRSLDMKRARIGVGGITPFMRLEATRPPKTMTSILLAWLGGGTDTRSAALVLPQLDQLFAFRSTCPHKLKWPNAGGSSAVPGERGVWRSGALH